MPTSDVPLSKSQKKRLRKKLRKQQAVLPKLSQQDLLMLFEECLEIAQNDIDMKLIDGDIAEAQDDIDEVIAEHNLAVHLQDLEDAARDELCEYGDDEEASDTPPLYQEVLEEFEGNIRKVSIITKDDRGNVINVKPV